MSAELKIEIKDQSGAGAVQKGPAPEAPPSPPAQQAPAAQAQQPRRLSQAEWKEFQQLFGANTAKALERSNLAPPEGPAEESTQQRVNEDYVARQRMQDEKRERQFRLWAEDRQHKDETSLDKMQLREQKEAEKKAERAERERAKDKSGLDLALDAAQQMRGVLGGVFGPAAGSMLDVVAAVRRTQRAQQRASGSASQGAQEPTEMLEAMPADAEFPEALPAAEGAGGGAAKAAMGAIAGPAAIAVAVAYAVKQVTDAAIGFAKSAGSAAASLAAFEDSPQRLAQMGKGLEDVGDKLFWVNPAVGAFGKSLGAALGVVSQFDAALQGTVERLADYSGQLAQQQAQQEVVRMERELNRAQRFGDNIADANEARFRMEQKLADVTDRLMPLVMTLAERVFDKVERGLTVMDEGIKIGAATADVIVTIAERAFPIAALLVNTDKIHKTLKEMGEDNEERVSDAQWQEFLGMRLDPAAAARQLPGQQMPPAPRGGAVMAPPGI